MSESASETVPTADVIVDADGHLCEPFPADSGRFVVDATGYHAVIVNGEPLHEDGSWTGATPGHVVRSR
jgi:N-acyl-D-aspartate/D-glutamate deacylase